MPTPTLQHEPRLTRVAAVVADASRSRMLCFLLDGDYASAGELAQAASVSAATASGHLAKLLDAGLLACEQRGRHRYYRLADADVAHALEALAMVAERGSHTRTWSSPARARLRYARCCYGHMAGQLGVAVLQGLHDQRWLEPVADGGFVVTDLGVQALREMGLDGENWQRMAGNGGRGVAYGCLDWSERRDHLAGKLAGALLKHFLDRGWLTRRAGDRALEYTPAGQHALRSWVRLPPSSHP
jgi:DNA-binding transcriptional ArsR family regulator